jgi:hypothetical protein
VSDAAKKELGAPEPTGPARLLVRRVTKANAGASVGDLVCFACAAHLVLNGGASESFTCRRDLESFACDRCGHVLR